MTANLNNLNFEAIKELVGSIQQEPTKADTTWKSVATWTGGMAAKSQSRDLPAVIYDEPPKLAGENTGPNPVEHLLGAFAACLVLGYAANATAAGIEIEDLKVQVEGDLDLHTFLGLNPDGNAGFKGIRAKVDIKSNATPEQLEDLHRRTVATSPVGHTLNRPVGVNVELGQIVEED